jgi:hypothetical protein
VAGTETSTEEELAGPSLILKTGKVHTVTVAPALRLRLFDDQRAPLADAPFRVTFGPDDVIEGTASGNAIAYAELPSFCPVKVTVEWGKHPVFEYAFSLDVYPECGTGDAVSNLVARLTNLGYPAESDLENAAKSFQLHYGVDADPEPAGLLLGLLPRASQTKLDEIFGTALDASTTIETQVETEDRSDHSDEGLD